MLTLLLSKCIIGESSMASEDILSRADIAFGWANFQSQSLFLDLSNTRSFLQVSSPTMTPSKGQYIINSA